MKIRDKFKSLLYNESEYIRTEILTDTVKPIPFNERLEFGDVFSIKARDYYSDDYWSEYSVLQQDTILKNQIKPLYNTDESKEKLTIKINQPKEKIIHKIYKNLSAGLGLNYFPANILQGEYYLSYYNGINNVSISENINALNFIISFYLIYNYKIYKNWEIDFASYSSLIKKFNLENFDLGISRRFILNNRTNPIIMRLSLLYSDNKFSRDFPVYENDIEFNFADKKIDANKIQFGLGNKINGLKPKISLEFKRKKRLWITTSFSYLFPLKYSDRLYLQEKSGFFMFRKKGDINLSNENIEIRLNGEQTNISPIKINNYFFDIGLMLRF